MFEIIYKPKFLRRFGKLPEGLKEEVEEALELLKHKSNHKKLKVHKLKGKLSEFYSCSVNYNYRIVFDYENKKTIVCHTVGDHDIYK